MTSDDKAQPSSGPSQPSREGGGLPTIDVFEYGGRRLGEKQSLNERLFMQLFVFRIQPGASSDQVTASLAMQLRDQRIEAVIYADTNDPRSLGLLTWSTDPSWFVRQVRPLFSAEPLRDVVLRDEFTMLGRSYGTGHEPDLAFALLQRPVRNALDPEFAWHVWYPLRRTGAFARLDPSEQQAILREHAVLGHAYGQQELAHDIRLASYGLDANDNEFVIGLVGRELHPLSHLVQSMRKTKQTSEFIQQMGPFFVGYVLERIERSRMP